MTKMTRDRLDALMHEIARQSVGKDYNNVLGQKSGTIVGAKVDRERGDVIGTVRIVPCADHEEKGDKVISAIIASENQLLGGIYPDFYKPEQDLDETMVIRKRSGDDPPDIARPVIIYVPILDKKNEDDPLSNGITTGMFLPRSGEWRMFGSPSKVTVEWWCEIPNFNK